jgi:iron complex outermembrane receptor protein
MKIRSFIAGASALAITLGGGSAFAQSLDYTSLSELFGEPVTAGATGAPQRASDVPATMIIITQDDIQRFPEYDIPGVLRHYAGMDVSRFAVGDGQTNIRGFAAGFSPRLLVLVNGREVYMDSYGYTAWSTIPVQFDEIQQIEVVKGPQSALYGFNAVAGVVNIITRNAAHENYLTARADIGDGINGASIVGGQSFGDRFSVRFSIGTMDADDFDPAPFNIRAAELDALGVDHSRDSASLAARFAITDKVSISAEITSSEVATAEGTGTGYSVETSYETDSYKIDLEADTSIGFITASTFQNETVTVFDFGPLENSLTGYRIQNLVKIGANDTIRVSAEYREAEAISFPEPGNGAFGYESTAFSAMWNHKFSNALDITLAGRYDSVDWSRDGDPNPFFYAFTQDDYSVTFEEFSYNAALVWRPDFGGAMRFSAAQGVQAPTLFDIGFTLPIPLGGGFAAISGNPNSQPAIIQSFEVAYDRPLSESVALRAAIFTDETTDVKGSIGAAPTYLPPAYPVPTFLFDNRGDTETFGGEVTLIGTPEGPWDWQVNYT